MFSLRKGFGRNGGRWQTVSVMHLGHLLRQEKVVKPFQDGHARCFSLLL